MNLTARLRGSTLRRLLLITVLLLSGMVIQPAPATAASLYTSGCLADGYICMFYDDGGKGANLGVYYNVPDFANPAKYFPHNCGLVSDGNPSVDCKGGGTHFWNGVASAYNCDSNNRATIWYNQNYGGPAVTLGNATSDYFYVSLQSTRSPLWNNNRAVSFAYAPGPPNSNLCFYGHGD